MDVIVHEYDASNSSAMYPSPTNFSENYTLFDEPTGELHELVEFCDKDNMEEFNCSVQQYLLIMRGLQQQPLSVALPMTILYVCIFVTGVMGNLIVCIVIVRHATMHTATNYYLFSLAVSDLIFLLLGLPYELSLYWHQYPYSLGIVFCKLRALVSEASSYVSVLTIVAFSMERFLAICYPLHLHTMGGLQRPVRIIAILWVVSFVCAVPFAVFSEIDIIQYPKDNSSIPESAFCAILENPPLLWEFSSCVFFAIPMVVMVIMYSKMGFRIRTRQTSALGVQRGSMHQESKKAKSRRAIIRMLATVVIAFFICWAPFHLQRLFYLYGQDWEHYYELYHWVFPITGVLYYVSCTINPILYNVMSQRYRVAFRETLCGKRKYHHNFNGFSRDQSSFRDTQEVTQLNRERSLLSTSNRRMKKSAEHIKLNDELTLADDNRLHQNSNNFSTNGFNAVASEMVIVRLNNGRPMCYTAVKNNLNNKTSMDNGSNLAETSNHSEPVMYTTNKIETCI